MGSVDETMPQAPKTLNSDIWLEVLDILRDTSPRSLLNVALTSKGLYSLSPSFIYRSICFTFNRKRRDINGNLIKRLLADSALCAKIREIEVLWAPNANLQPGEGSKEDLELLGQALPGMTGLNALIWDAQYPILSWLLDILRFHFPKCKLYTFHPPSSDSARTLPRLRGFPCLYSLDVTLLAGQHAACRELEKLVDASQLTDLAINTSYDFPRRTQPMLTPLQLRSLDMNSYLHHSWRPVFSWSMLERLSMDDIAWLPEVASQLTNLKSLHLNVGINDRGQSLTSFLLTCERLEVLDLTGFTRDVQIGEESLWRHLGKTLVKLRLHQRETIMGGRPLPNTMNREMGLIASQCPKLRSLGLEIEGDGAWRKEMNDMIDIIASSFWYIVHLELKVSTPVTLNGVAVLWTQVWQNIQTSRLRKSHDVTLPRLRSLDVVGDYQLSFSADLAERDDEACKGVVVVRCVELEALKSKLSPSGPLWNREQAKVLAAVTKGAEIGTRTYELPTNLDLEMTRPRAFWDRHDENRFMARINHNAALNLEKANQIKSIEDSVTPYNQPSNPPNPPTNSLSIRSANTTETGIQGRRSHIAYGDFSFLIWSDAHTHLVKKMTADFRTAAISAANDFALGVKIGAKFGTMIFTYGAFVLMIYYVDNLYLIDAILEVFATVLEATYPVTYSLVWGGVVMFACHTKIRYIDREIKW